MAIASSDLSNHDSRPQATGNGLGPLFPYIWRNSRRQQIIILLFVLVSLPFYFLSLDIPKNIVNDAIQGRAFKHGNAEAPLFGLSFSLPSLLGGHTLDYPGISFSRIGYLMALSAAFMLLVLVNGAFRYVVNMQKGKLGERLLRRLRLDLFNLLLRFSPEAVRTIRSAEVATIIRDEVEPIGGFVGDAFIQPAFLGSQAVTALLFIILQSPFLGMLAGGIILVQGIIIPRLRREQLRLGRQRQVRSRSLAGHIGEIVDGMAEVSNHGTAGYERQKITNILDELFWIRYDLYGRKFMVKFINSVLAQVTPFLFYSFGGYLALKGSLDIGQLVAVIAAYRDLPPPIKELIDWDQQRLDVQVKYNQILEQFSHAELPPAAEASPGENMAGSIEIEALKVRAPGGDLLLDGANLVLPLGSRILLTGARGDGFITLAQVLARRIADYSGKVRLAGHDMATLPATWIGSCVGYLGPETVIFGRSLRNNIIYSLRRPSAFAETRSDEDISGPRAATPDDDDPDGSVDHHLAGAASSEELDRIIVELLHEVGLAPAIYGFGLAHGLPADLDADLAGRIVEARRALIQALKSPATADLVEPFDPQRYNRHATVGENLFFGVARHKGAIEALIEDGGIEALISTERLADDLANLGLKVAATMVEIFSNVSSDHHLFDRFSFISSSDLPRFAEIVRRASTQGIASLRQADRQPLLMLSFQYVESRHRLDLLTPQLCDKIVRIRTELIRSTPAALTQAVEFYDPDRPCLAAPLRDNLLFGRINHAIAGADEHVDKTLRSVVRDCGLEQIVYSLGLDQEAGPGGRLLLAAHRSAIGLIRSLIKQPKILILDQLGLLFPDADRGMILNAVRKRMAGRTLVVAMREPQAAEDFDLIVTTAGARIESAMRAGATPAVPSAPAELHQDEQAEIQALREVPMFALLDTPRLKLIAFASERVSFAAGQVLFRQGDRSDAAYIILTGTADVFLERPAGQMLVSTTGKHSIIGEMGVISGAHRTATIVATSEVIALRIARDIFLDLIAELPSIALAVMRDQIRRLNASEERFAKMVAATPVPAFETAVKPATSQSRA